MSTTVKKMHHVGLAAAQNLLSDNIRVFEQGFRANQEKFRMTIINLFENNARCGSVSLTLYLSIQRCLYCMECIDREGKRKVNCSGYGLQSRPKVRRMDRIHDITIRRFIT